jgi:phage shock protein E
MKRTILVVLIMGFLANLLFGGGTSKTPDIPALIKEGAVVIDVRSAGEFSGGHIEGAINIPHTVIADKIAQHEIDKTKNIVVYCQSGARSSAAKKSLVSKGYTHVINGGGLGDMRKVLEEK